MRAVNQYWLHYRLLDNWGYKVLAKKWRKESIEEMRHADKLIERIIFLDGNPNMQTLESLRIGQTVKEVLDRDLQAEMEARTLYEEAATYCHNRPWPSRFSIQPLVTAKACINSRDDASWCDLVYVLPERCVQK
jgi:bacterioferritin